jgi:hypothetical protein
MDPKSTRGKRVPDLVLVLDSDPAEAPQFKVQCEITLDTSEAQGLYDDLFGGHGAVGITRAHQKIKSKLAHQTSHFQQIVHLAFRDNGSTD